MAVETEPLCLGGVARVGPLRGTLRLLLVFPAGIVGPPLRYRVHGQGADP